MNRKEARCPICNEHTPGNLLRHLQTYHNLGIHFLSVPRSDFGDVFRFDFQCVCGYREKLNIERIYDHVCETGKHQLILMMMAEETGFKI